MRDKGIASDLMELSARIMLAHDNNDRLRLVSDFNAVIERVIKRETQGVERVEKKAVSAVIKFTKEEIITMDTTFKKAFIANGLAAHITKRVSGKNSYCYEIRYRQNGYNISASSTDLATAKRKFIDKTTPTEIAKYYIGRKNQSFVPSNFEAFAWYYFNNFRKERVADKTFRCDCNRLKRNILPAIGAIDIKKITPLNCKKIVDSLMEQEKCKTAVEVYNILSCIFKSAIAHGIIMRSPLSIVSKPTYSQEHGTTLTTEEERRVLDGMPNKELRQAIAIALYCGLRPNEIESAHVYKNDFIKAKNSKQRKKDKQEEVYKIIPISKMLRPFISDGIYTIPSAQVIRKTFHKVLPNHILYDCRTTFYSRCKACKVDQRALDEFMGHSLGKIGNAYTDLPLDFLLEEGKKISY